jgi:tetratricopeptide (TPR) repeat protein
MDSRGAARLWMVLLIAAGCQHQASTVPNAGPQPTKPIDPAQIKKANGKPKDLPPQVVTTSADFKAGEAAYPERPPEEARQIREQARQDYEKALKVNPKYVPAYQGLARLYNAMNERERAVETYQKALQIDPKNAPLWYELALCHKSDKNWNAALECIHRAQKLDPPNRTYINAMGVVLALAGRYDESLSCFVRTSGGEALGCYRLAQTLDRLQQPGLSRFYLETALRKDPNLAENMNPAVEQTAYQSPAAPPPSVPAPPPAAAPQPKVVTPTPRPQSIPLPPPPPS